MNTLVAAIVLASAAVSSCGSQRNADSAASPGSCPQEAVDDGATKGGGMFAHGADLPHLFAPEREWFAITSIGNVTRAARPSSRADGYYPDEVFADLDGQSARGAAVSRHSVRVQKRLVDAWEQRPDGAIVWAPLDSQVWIAVETFADGTVAFVGACAGITHDGAFRRFVEARRTQGDTRSPAHLLRAVLAQPTGPEASSLSGRSSRKTIGWADRFPASRQYGPDTPADVLARTPVRNLTVTAPVGWRAFEGTVCFRSPGAWGGCAAFGAIAAGTPAEVTTHFDGNAPVEIWLLDASGDLTKPIVRLGTISPQQMAAKTLDVVADSTIVAYDDLVDQARRRPVMTAVAT